MVSSGTSSDLHCLIPGRHYQGPAVVELELPHLQSFPLVVHAMPEPKEDMRHTSLSATPVADK